MAKNPDYTNRPRVEFEYKRRFPQLLGVSPLVVVCRGCACKGTPPPSRIAPGNDSEYPCLAIHLTKR